MLTNTDVNFIQRTVRTVTILGNRLTSPTTSVHRALSLAHVMRQHVENLESLFRSHTTCGRCGATLDAAGEFCPSCDTDPTADNDGPPCPACGDSLADPAPNNCPVCGSAAGENPDPDDINDPPVSR